MVLTDPRIVTWSAKYDAPNQKLTLLCVWRNYVTGTGWAKIQWTDATDVELVSYEDCISPIPQGEFFNYTKLEKTGVATVPASLKLKLYRCSSDTLQNCAVSPGTCTTPTLTASQTWATPPTAFNPIVYTAPQILTAKVGDTLSVVSWTYPATGIPFIYEVKYYPTSNPSMVTTLYTLYSNTVIALQNLVNKTQYTIEVRAISASGVVGTVATTTVTPAACQVCTTADCPPCPEKLSPIQIGAGLLVGSVSAYMLIKSQKGQKKR